MAARRLGFANIPGAIAMATGGRILPQAGEVSASPSSLARMVIL